MVKLTAVGWVLQVPDVGGANEVVPDPFQTEMVPHVEADGPEELTPASAVAVHEEFAASYFTRYPGQFAGVLPIPVHSCPNVCVP